MDFQARGLIKGLENWAKKVTSGYRDVDVVNMSSSFRNGLAFCAIIHHYRPDLIDFDSLSKQNIFENNSLAFNAAERQLGVPALLDAEDMVKYDHPDRLSIITYLSQLHNCFENQNKVKNLRASFKRSRNTVTTGPPTKVPLVQPPKLLSSNRHEVCHTCKNRVFILERLIVDRKLYHTTCFKCCKCNSLLNPGAYVESDTPGLYECAVCPREENSNSIEFPESESFESESPNLARTPAKQPASPILRNSSANKSPFSDSVNNARSSFLQGSLVKSPEVKKINSPFLRNNVSPATDLKKDIDKSETSDSGFSVKDKISAFESNRNSKPESFFKSVDVNNGSSAKSPSASTESLTSEKLFKISQSSLNSTQTNHTTTSAEENTSAQLSTSTDTTPPESPTSKTVPSVVLRNTQLNRSPSSSSDKITSDSGIASPTNLDKVPTSSSRLSLQLQSSSGDDSVKSANMLYQMGEYKSPLKSRDIFQTNLQPLKLSLSSTPRKGMSTSAVPDIGKIGSIDAPQIRSTYSSKTLPRPGSDGNLSPKLKSSEISSTSESNISSVLHSKWSRPVTRRSSLESKKHSEIVSETDSGKCLTAEICTDGGDASTKFGGYSSKFQISPVSSTKLSGNIFRTDRQEVPIPSIRQSLEISRNKTFDVKIEPVDSANDSAVTVSSENSKSVSDIRASNEQALEISSSISPSKPEVTPVVSEQKKSKSKKEYPDDLNPFGDEEEEEEYPDDLNPFGDDDADETPSSSKIKISTEDYDESKNPFASDDDDDTAPSAPPPRPPPPKSASPYQQKSPYGTMSSPSGSLRGTLKKRLAPKPPKLSEIFQTDSQGSETDISLKASPSIGRKSLQTPSPKVKKTKPAPPPPSGTPSRQTSEVDLTASTKQLKEADNLKLKSTSVQEDQKQAKKKKRPAPPVPIPKRKDNKKIPLKDILREMREIEEKQRECERQGREIELLIRDRDKDEEATVEEEEYIMQLFELVNQKNALFRRQAELMYIKRSQRLEEQQAEIEMQIRQLLEKPEAEKTDEDRAKEEELILELKDIVDQRSSIIDSIEMDRRRELEEDASVQEQIEIKNGDLPITAEIKEKNTGKQKKKDKKEKKKKEKKKHEDDDKESKKNSSKKKSFFK